ncbi:MAG TPA: helix-turn-helix domain-containing protein [Gammaproteobacteria bacterium]|nr:helix-turn-helix domain-containing protein [Gammaproteobacteria bacterium]
MLDGDDAAIRLLHKALTGGNGGNMLPAWAFEALASTAEVPAPFPEGRVLFDVGEIADDLLLVRAGMLAGDSGGKTRTRQVTGFFLPGEFADIESLCTLRHAIRVSALTTCSVVRLPMSTLLERERESRELQDCLHRIIGRGLHNLDQLLYSLSRQSSTARIAAFYLRLSERFHAFGNAPDRFHFPALHGDIASYLHMTGSTFSRGIMRLQRKRLLALDGADVRLLDTDGLRKLAMESL